MLVFCLCLLLQVRECKIIQRILKKNSFFLNIILSHVLHSSLGLIEIYEYENKQKRSFPCYNTVTSPWRSILNFTCSCWFCPVGWMKLCSAPCRPRLKIFHSWEHEELWSDCRAGGATDPSAPAPLSQVLLCALWNSQNSTVLIQDTNLATKCPHFSEVSFLLA